MTVNLFYFVGRGWSSVGLIQKRKNEQGTKLTYFAWWYLRRLQGIKNYVNEQINLGSSVRAAMDLEWHLTKELFLVVGPRFKLVQKMNWLEDNICKHLNKEERAIIARDSYKIMH